MRPSIWLLAAALGSAQSFVAAPDWRARRAGAAARRARPRLRAAGLSFGGSPGAAVAAARGGHARKLATFAALFLSSALLHAAEVAITTLYPWKVKEFAEAEPSTGVFTMLDRDITRVLYTLLVCSTACTVCGTALAASALAELCAGAPRRAAAATLGFAAGSIFLGELLPKTLAVANAERVARRAVPLVRAAAVVLAPVGAFFGALAQLCLAPLGLAARGDAAALGVSERGLRLLVAGARRSGALGARESRMVDGVLDLRATRVAEVMTPRDFFKGFTDASVFSAAATNESTLYALKDWPSEAEFRDWMPAHFSHFIAGLPFPEYTNPRDGPHGNGCMMSGGS